MAEARIADRILPLGKDPSDAPHAVLLGSILHWADRNSHVCGAGLIDGTVRLRAAPASITCVRGPMTRAGLVGMGLACPPVFADPGVLARDLFPDPGLKTHDVGVIPHYVDRTAPWLTVARDQGARIISVSEGLDRYFDGLTSCRVILSSTLHGLIFSHAFGIPALWLELSDAVLGNGFKFFDYYASVGIPHQDVRRWPVKGDERLADLADHATVADQTALREACLDALDKTRILLAQAEATHETGRRP